MITNKNLHLALSVFLVLIIGLVYGLSSGTILQALFGFKIDSNNLHQVFRATMGLYLGMAILWTLGIFKAIYWGPATISNIFFMGGLAFGRMISLALDGFPSIYFSIGLILELILAFWGLRNLKEYRRTLV